MPTGDQTAYLRSKIAERGTKAAKFMVDGFDAWASSERPARVGGVEKTPSESQMTSRMVGGIRYHAKGMGPPKVSSPTYVMGQYQGKANPQGYTPGKEMKGGAIDAQWILANAQKLYDFYQNALKFTKDVKEDLRSEEVPIKYKKIASDVAEMIERVGFGMSPGDALKKCVHEEYSKSGRRGGAADWSSWVKEWSQKLVTFYNWYIKNKEGIHYVLNMKAINPENFDYARQFSGMLKSVGLGKPCSCPGSRRRLRGGDAFTDFFTGSQPAQESYAKMEPVASEGYASRDPSYEQAAPPEPEDEREATESEKYERVVKKYNEVMSSTKSEAYKQKWLEQNAQIVNYLKSKGLIGGNIYDVVKAAKSSATKMVRGPFGEYYPAKGGRRGGEMEMSAKKFSTQELDDEVEYGDDGKFSVRARKPGSDGAVMGESYGRMVGREPEDDMSSRKLYVGEGSMASRVASSYAKKKVLKMLGGASCGGRKPSARGAIVKRVMAEQGLSLPQASKYVKEHGLY